MHVVQIAPPWYPLPPAGYGGIERVVYDLTEGLIAAGHEVTLLAPGDSRTSARLIPTIVRGLGLDIPDVEKSRRLFETGRSAFQTAGALGADVVHDHSEVPAPPGYGCPVVRTIHGPAVDASVAACRDLCARGDRFIAISRRQRELFDLMAAEQRGPGRHIAFAGVVHNPLDVAGAPFYPAPAKEGYAAFLGRCHWEKGPDAAIRIAQAAGVPLKMALRELSTDEQPYFDATVRPLVEASRGMVELVGEVGGRKRDEFIGRANAVIFSSPWEEPFGLVLTEAAARGTPVVAFARGAAPEIVVDGVTGILCADEEAMARALPRAMALDPAACRAHAAAHFDRQPIARHYADLFARVVAETAKPVPGLSLAETAASAPTAALE